MAEDTIRRISEAELRAEKLELEARQKRDILISEARNEAELLLSAATDKSSKKKESTIEDARSLSEKRSQEELASYEAELEALSAKAAARRPDAVKKIIAAVLG